MVINPDNLQVIQNKDWFDYTTQALITIGTIIAAIGVGSWAWNIIFPKKEKAEGEFTFEVKEKPYRVIFGLRNTGKNRIDFDPEQGLYVHWGNNKYHKINLPEDKKNSSIQPQGSVQLRYLIELDSFEKSIIDSGKIKVFIYTNRNNRFQLNPTIGTQLKTWRITKEQYEENVKSISNSLIK